MTGPLTPAQLDDYARDGFVVLGAVVGDDERCELTAEEARLRPPGAYGTSGGLVVMDQLEHLSAAVRRFCCDGAHLDAVEQLLGPDVALTHNQFVTKLPDAGERASDIPLHQDDGYGTLDPPLDVTVWVPLIDTTSSNGCLVVVPGSHHRGLLEHEVSASNPAFREVAGGGALPLELPAGHAVAFSGLLLHGSLDNRSSIDRVALFARYCHPSARMMTEGGKPVLDDGHSWMVRGQASPASWRSANEKFTA